MPVELQGQAAVTATLEQIDIVHRMMRKYPETFELALTADDVERIFKKGKIASLIGMEGGHSIDNSLGALRMFYRLGARYMTLTHSKQHAVGGLGDRYARSLDGLSPFGEAGRASEMNWLGMLVDSQPRVARHDGGRDPRLAGAGDLLALVVARALNDHPAQRARQHPAAAAEERRRRDGHVRAGLPVTEGHRLEQAADGRAGAPEGEQFPSDAAAVKAGRRRVDRRPTPRRARRSPTSPITSITSARSPASITSASAATSTASPASSRDSTTCRSIRALTAELLRRGYNDDDVKKILGLNILRVMREVEKVSTRLQKERAASPLLFTR